MRITGFELFHGRVIDLNAEITKQDIAILTALVATATLVNPTNSLAATGEISEKMAKATEPIKDLLLAAADPVCYIVFVWGLLESMLGKGASGLTRMKYAALGYMGMNWLPVLMDIMRNAKP